jgi:hypothetical protein
MKDQQRIKANAEINLFSPVFLLLYLVKGTALLRCLNMYGYALQKYKIP